MAEQERAATAATTGPRAAAASTAPAPRAARRSRLRRVLATLAALMVLAAGAGRRRSRRRGRSTSWAPTTAGLVTLYRGLPYDLPLGVELYSEQYASSVPARTIGRARRERVLDHEWRSRADAEDLVRQLERGTLDTGSTPMSARTRELFGLIPVSLLVSAGFAAVLRERAPRT